MTGTRAVTAGRAGRGGEALQGGPRRPGLTAPLRRAARRWPDRRRAAAGTRCAHATARTARSEQRRRDHAGGPDATFMYMTASSSVGVAELRQNLSRLPASRAASGERLVVTDRNRPVAELGPPSTAGAGSRSAPRRGPRVAALAKRPARCAEARRRPACAQPRPGRGPGRALAGWRSTTRTPRRSSSSCATSRRARSCAPSSPTPTLSAASSSSRRCRGRYAVPSHTSHGCRLDVLLERAGELFDALALLPVDRGLLTGGGCDRRAGAALAGRDPLDRRDRCLAG